MVLLAKKPGSKKPEDMRPITILNSLYKVIDKVMTKRLTDEAEAMHIIDEAQAGFMKGSSTADQIFKLQTIIDYHRKKDREIHCAFLDIKKAFDSVRRKDLYEVMLTRGITLETVTMIKAMYTNETSSFIINGGISRYISIRRGVRQGGSSSPLCFNFIPNELVRAIRRAGLGVKIRTDIGEMQVGILLYADDIALLANTKEELQTLCDISSA